MNKKETKMKEPLNIPQIKKYIKETHTEFMKSLGPQIEKVAADHRLQADIIHARLLPIMICLKEAKVIDDFITSAEGYNKVIKLVKEGYDSYVFITTNGLEILVEGLTYVANLAASDFLLDKKFSDKKLFSTVQDDDFDWVDFSETLLDYIHSSIYERQKATEIKIGSILGDNDRR